MMDESKEGNMNMTDDIGTVLYTCWTRIRAKQYTHFISRYEKLRTYFWEATSGYFYDTFYLDVTTLTLL